jgi:hypothetical protein
MNHMKTLQKLAVLAVASALAAPAAAQLNLPIGKQKEVEKLSKNDISKEMLLKNGDIDKCKEEHKKKEPKVTGNLAARFAVGTDGKPTDISIVSTQFKNTTFATCLSDKIRGWTFSKAKEKSANYDLLAAF